jgi:hypothetical protein
MGSRCKVLPLVRPPTGEEMTTPEPDNHSILLRESTLEECRDRDLREFEEWWKNKPNSLAPVYRSDALFIWMAARGHK